MKDEILKYLECQLDKKTFEKIKDKKLNLGVFCEPCLSYMLMGKKTIESRFSRNKILPYNKIDKDTVVIVKKSSGGVVAYFTIKDVMFIDLTVNKIDEIREKYNDKLCVSDEFWIQKEKSRYATLIFIDKLVKLEPFKISKKGMQSWLVL